MIPRIIKVNMIETYSDGFIFQIIWKYDDLSIAYLKNYFNISTNRRYNRIKLVIVISKVYNELLLSSVKPNAQYSICSNRGIEQ